MLRSKNSITPFAKTRDSFLTNIVSLFNTLNMAKRQVNEKAFFTTSPLHPKNEKNFLAEKKLSRINI